MRGAPRDALLSQSCGQGERGKAFGFQRAMDHAGAMAGPLIATLLLSTLALDLRTVFILSIVPAFFCVFILFRGVTDIAGDQTPARPILKLRWNAWNRRFKYFLLIVTLFTLGNSSDAFLLLRAKDLGINIVSIPILWFFFHFSKTIFSIPGGALSDKIGRRGVMILAWTIYGLVYLGFAFASKNYHVWLLFLFMASSSVWLKGRKELG